MYLLYLDDSGSAGNRSESNLVLAGICVFERHMHWLISELDKIALEINPTNPQAVEFHASEIFSRRTPPWQGMTKETATAVIKRVLTVFQKSYAENVAFACVVHKSSFPGVDPMEKSFEDLSSRFDKRLKRLYEVKKEAHRGIIILDESSHETSLQNLSINFRSYGTQWGGLRNISEVPLFVNSKASRLVQIADHIAYAVFRRFEHGDTSYFDIISSKFDAENGVIHGLSHKHQLPTRCMCLACASRL
jgi:hypothetical protein